MMEVKLRGNGMLHDCEFPNSLSLTFSCFNMYIIYNQLFNKFSSLAQYLSLMEENSATSSSNHPIVHLSDQPQVITLSPLSILSFFARSDSEIQANQNFIFTPAKS